MFLGFRKRHAVIFNKGTHSHHYTFHHFLFQPITFKFNDFNRKTLQVVIN